MSDRIARLAEGESCALSFGDSSPPLATLPAVRGLCRAPCDVRDDGRDESEGRRVPGNAERADNLPAVCVPGESAGEAVSGRGRVDLVEAGGGVEREACAQGLCDSSLYVSAGVRVVLERVWGAGRGAGPAVVPARPRGLPTAAV